MSIHRIILCPGQGAQVVGMARVWCEVSPEARAVFAEADAVLGTSLGAPLSTLCFEGPADRLNQTDVSQPALYAAGVACWRALLAGWGAGASAASAEAGLIAAAGLSLGEYTALHIAGAFDFGTGLRLVAIRGRAMQDAATGTPSGMVAIIGADEQQAERVCGEVLSGLPAGEVLVCANFNAPGQIVISGTKAACERAAAPEGPAAAMGFRATALSVAGAFHSPIMASAGARLAAALASADISAPRAVVYSNVTAQAHVASASDSIRKRLVEQLTSPVRWSQSCATMVGEHAGVNPEYHELAPGKTLTGLFRRIDRAVKVHTHDTPTD
ncbi:MAG: ACP S-malonyltransferase [Phycisphaerales bacterium]